MRNYIVTDEYIIRNNKMTISKIKTVVIIISIYINLLSLEKNHFENK